MSLDTLEEELLANLEDVYVPVSSLTPSKQPTIAVGSPLTRSVSSAQSLGSNASPNSDRQRLEGIPKANSVGVTTQPSHTAVGLESTSTSEVSIRSLKGLCYMDLLVVRLAFFKDQEKLREIVIGLACRCSDSCRVGVH